MTAGELLRLWGMMSAEVAINRMSDHGSFTQKASADHGCSGLSFRRLTNDPRSYSLFHITAPRILVLSTINEQRSLHFQARPRTMDVLKNTHRAANLNQDGGVTFGMMGGG